MEEKDETQQNTEPVEEKKPFYQGALPDRPAREAYDPFNGEDPAAFYAKLIGADDEEEEKPKEKRAWLLPAFLAGLLLLSAAAFSYRGLSTLPYIAPPATPTPAPAFTPQPSAEPAFAPLPGAAVIEQAPNADFERTALVVDGRKQGVLVSREAAETLLADVSAYFEGVVREKYEIQGALTTAIDNEIEFLPSPETDDAEVVTAEALFAKLTESGTRLDVLCTETLREEEIEPCKSEEKDDKYLLKGTKIIEEPGQDGMTAKTLTILYKNGRRRTENADEKTETRPMVARVVRVGTQKITDKAEPGKKEGKKGPDAPEGATFLSPVEDGKVILNYGQSAGVLHLGLDYAPKEEDAADVPVLASCGGTVVCVMERGGYGKMVELDHGGGFVTRYAHLQSAAVKLGDVVMQGDPVGVMGQSGNVSARMLHFELRIDGEAYNPRYYIR
ncbi:MAG: peptidoglycan DD-metalloendopeptidase family protein [Eubacteriales bacterium]|nr:peptidoglycan DD-metalloendopeptidase family protein [Eubacteriales bacterium]